MTITISLDFISQIISSHITSLSHFFDRLSSCLDSCLLSFLLAITSTLCFYFSNHRSLPVAEFESSQGSIFTEEAVRFMLSDLLFGSVLHYSSFLKG